MKIQRRGAMMLGAIALGVLPLTLASPAFAATHTASLTVGPVALPSVPVNLCVDGTCTPTTALVNETLKVDVTTDASVSPVSIVPALCPAGELGLAVKVSATSASASATITASLSGTALNGQAEQFVVGPETVNLTTGGVVVSACATV